MELFLFPLSQVVFHPATSKPLNIFEPRYLQMVHDSIKTGTPIGLGYVDEPEGLHQYIPGEKLPFVREVMGYGHPLIVEERPDGSLLIFLQGKGKARIGKSLMRSEPYIICEAEEIPEYMEIETNWAPSYLQVQKLLMQWLNTHITDPSNREQFLKSLKGPGEVVGCYSSYVINDHDLQQLILEADDINEKIRLITGIVASGEAN